MTQILVTGQDTHVISLNANCDNSPHLGVLTFLLER